MRNYINYQKINAKKAEKIFALISDIYERNEKIMKEWKRNDNIKNNQHLTYYAVDINLVDVFHQINTIFSLCERNEPFAEIEGTLKAEIVKSEEFLNSHRYCFYINEIYELWKGDWKSDPYKNFHECMDAIRAINNCSQYDNIFTKKELLMLDSILK